MTVCLGVAQACSKVRVTCIVVSNRRELSGLCLEATSLLVPETFEFKVLEM